MDSLVLILVLLLLIGAVLIVLFLLPEWMRKLRALFVRQDPNEIRNSSDEERQTDDESSGDDASQGSENTGSPNDADSRQSADSEYVGDRTEPEPAVSVRNPKLGFAANLRYYSKGSELGFSYKELRELKRMAQAYGIFDGKNLLVAKLELNRFLRLLVVRGYKEGLLTLPDSAELIYKLFSYRLDVERDRPRYRRGIASTRTIPAGQELRLLIPGFGSYTTKLIENYRPYLCVEVPIVKRASANAVSWKSRSMEVFFWRAHDGLYSFETVVMNDPSKSETRTVLNLSHSDHLTRTQKRSHVRVSVMRNGHVVPLNRPEDADEVVPPGKGWLCRVVDISASGAAILVRGRVKPGRLVKLTIELGGIPIVMSGEIKAVNLDPKRGVSLLHLEAIPLSKGMRVRIMAYSLGFLTDKKPQELAEKNDDSESRDGETGEDRAGMTPESLFGIKAGNYPRINEDDIPIAGGGVVSAKDAPEKDLDELFPDEDKSI